MLSRLQDTFFSFFIDAARRILSVVDGLALTWSALRGRPMRVPAIGGRARFQAGAHRLDGWLVKPLAAGETAVAVLILHGIGDKLTYWRQVQQMLACHGAASLVFDYGGYGSSEGRISQAGLEADAEAAYLWLRGTLGAETRVYVLGYSLGTGLAAEIAARLSPAPAGIILCQTYTTFRHAAGRVVRPLQLLTRMVPDLWRTIDAVQRLPSALLIVHGAGDRLFPVRMAEDVHASAAKAGAAAQLAVIGRHAHNAGYLQVAEDYWAPVLSFLRVHRGDA